VPGRVELPIFAAGASSPSLPSSATATPARFTPGVRGWIGAVLWVENGQPRQARHRRGGDAWFQGGGERQCVGEALRIGEGRSAGGAESEGKFGSEGERVVFYGHSAWSG